MNVACSVSERSYDVSDEKYKRTNGNESCKSDRISTTVMMEEIALAAVST